MKMIYLVAVICVAVFVCSCNDEAAEIVPQPPAAAQRDSTAAVTAITEAQPEPVAETVSDSIDDNSAAINDNPAGLDFRDSAHYQYARYNAMPYRVMTPSAYSNTGKYPLVIFLHGIDERGTDNESQLKWGASLFRSDSIRKAHPAFILFPQCPSGTLWTGDAPMNELKSLIENFASTNNVDRNRIYIVGISMGAYGTYEIVARNPGMFAAAIAISGDGDLRRAANMAKTQWRIFGGKKDNIVTSDKAEKMANGLRASGAAVSLTVYPNANHVGSWTSAFTEPDFCSWLFSVNR